VLSRRNLSHPSRRSRPSSAETATLTTFRINTCKSVSKQTTLTPFRMNTYEKPKGRGGASPGDSSRLPRPSRGHALTQIFQAPLPPSYAPCAARMDLRDAPRNASIPCTLIRLRILPVTTEVAPLYPSSLNSASTQSSLRLSVILCLLLPRLPAEVGLCFHKDTNPVPACPPWRGIPFIFTSMQNPGGAQ
jgi:hypothetical protein